MTINTILEEVKNVPVNRPEELYSVINSLKDNSGKPGAYKEAIRSFAGSFSEMKQEDYDDLTNNMKETRSNLLDKENDVSIHRLLIQIYFLNSFEGIGMLFRKLKHTWKLTVL